MVVPPVVIWTVGAIGAAIVATLAVREWRRVSAVGATNTAPVRATPREAIPRLRRDPVTGVYRP
jgi:hypothetical protein